MFKFLFQVGTIQTFFCRLIMLSSTSFFCIFIHFTFMTFEILTVPMPHALRCPMYVCMYVCNKAALKKKKKKKKKKKFKCKIYAAFENGMESNYV